MSQSSAHSDLSYLYALLFAGLLSPQATLLAIPLSDSSESIHIIMGNLGNSVDWEQIRRRLFKVQKQTEMPSCVTGIGPIPVSAMHC